MMLRATALVGQRCGDTLNDEGHVLIRVSPNMQIIPTSAADDKTMLQATRSASQFARLEQLATGLNSQPLMQTLPGGLQELLGRLMRSSTQAGRYSISAASSQVPTRADSFFCNSVFANVLGMTTCRTVP